MKKKLDKERVIAAIGWGESKAEKFGRDTQVISVKYLKREIEKISDAEVGDEPKEPEKVVVPRFVSKEIEDAKENHEFITNVINTVREKVKSWIGDDAFKREEIIVRAILDGYEVEQPKTYRFTLNAYHEIDVTAASFEEAQKHAEEAWNEYYVSSRDFGGVEFEKEVTD